MAGMKITIDVDATDALRWLHEAQAGRGADITDEVEDMRRRLAEADAAIAAVRAEARSEIDRRSARLAEVRHILDAYKLDDFGRWRPLPLLPFRAQCGPRDVIVRAVSLQAAADALVADTGSDVGNVRVWSVDDGGCTSSSQAVFTVTGRAEHHRSRGEWAARVEVSR